MQHILSRVQQVKMKPRISQDTFISHFPCHDRIANTIIPGHGAALHSKVNDVNRLPQSSGNLSRPNPSKQRLCLVIVPPAQLTEQSDQGSNWKLGSSCFNCAKPSLSFTKTHVWPITWSAMSSKIVMGVMVPQPRPGMKPQWAVSRKENIKNTVISTVSFPVILENKSWFNLWTQIKLNRAVPESMKCVVHPKRSMSQLKAGHPMNGQRFICDPFPIVFHSINKAK